MDDFNILHTEWSNGWGGQEIRIWGECRGMLERGHAVALAGCPEGELGRRAARGGIPFYPLAMAGPWDMAALGRLCRLIKKKGVQIVHTHSSVDSWLGGMAARLCGVKCVRTRHLSVPVSKNPLNFVYRLPQAVVTTGRGIRRHLVEDYGLPHKRVVSIPTGVDIGRFKPAEPDPGLRAELGLSPDKPVVAVVAVLRSWKRHDIFCQMAKRILAKKPEVRFLIVGDGPGRKRINGYLDEMGLRPAVLMTGHREDPERIFPLCTVCVSSSDKAEGVPQSLLQALACRRAVAASDAGDVGEVIRQEETGLLVPPGRVAPLAEAVARLLDGDSLRDRLGRQGRELVINKYSREQMLDATENVYRMVISGGMH